MRISDGVQTCALPISHPANGVHLVGCDREVEPIVVLHVDGVLLEAVGPHVLQVGRLAHPEALRLRARVGPGRALLEEGDDAGIAALGRPRARSEEHTSELQSLMRNSYAVFCLKKK